MGYKALEKVSELNKEKYKIGEKDKIEFPSIPEPFKEYRTGEKDENGRRVTAKVSQMEELAVKFIRKRCENLRFDETYMACDDKEGKSLKPNQIPYNMEKDLDRLCLEIAIHRFLESGHSKDAFDIYFCFLEMFLGEYGKTKKVIEMLSEFETNASSLLMKHRDHYSHSAYVFIMGLALYESSPAFRKAYKDSYKKFIKSEPLTNNNRGKKCAAAHFLKYWGITSLLHDIGYPFELSFEQVKSYFGNTIEYVPFVVFNMNRFINSKTDDLSPKADKLLSELSVKLSECMVNHTSEEKPSEEVCGKLTKKLSGLITDLYGSDGADFNGCGDFKCSDQGQKNKVKNFVVEKIVKEDLSLKDCYLNGIKFLESYKEKIAERRKKDEERLSKLLPELERTGVDNLNVYLAEALGKVLGDDYAEFGAYKKYRAETETKNTVKYQDYLYEVLNNRNNPEKCGGFIDHAYFSAIMLINCLFDVVKVEDLNEMYTNAITAIIMHNSLYKFSITNYTDNGDHGFNVGRHFRMERHPLAFLLMLCDEIQCWDRTSYGKNSRGEIHPIDCELKFSGNEITANYIFDSEQIKAYKEYEEKRGGAGDQKIKLKGTYEKLSDTNGKTKFLSDIEHIVSVNGDTSFDKRFGTDGKITLKVGRKEKNNRRYRSAFLSTSNYIHFYKFAMCVHQMNNLKEITMDEMEKKFNEMSLEYKINHISRAKRFARYLNEVGCFYSDKPVDLECVSEFKDFELQEKMGPLEHERWVWEHHIMGWKYGDLYNRLEEKTDEEKRSMRECLRIHCDMPDVLLDSNNKYISDIAISHFKVLDDATKEKDTNSINNLLRVLAREDGIKIYKI